MLKSNMSKFLKYKDQVDRINANLIKNYSISSDASSIRISFNNDHYVYWNFETKQQAEECLQWLDYQLLAIIKN